MLADLVRAADANGLGPVIDRVFRSIGLWRLTPICNRAPIAAS